MENTTRKEQLIKLVKNNKNIIVMDNQNEYYFITSTKIFNYGYVERLSSFNNNMKHEVGGWSIVAAYEVNSELMEKMLPDELDDYIEEIEKLEPIWNTIDYYKIVLTPFEYDLLINLENIDGSIFRGYDGVLGLCYNYKTLSLEMYNNLFPFIEAGMTFNVADLL